MKNIKLTNLIIALLLGFIFTVSSSCERGLSDDIDFATFSTNGDIFIDSPIGLGTFFYFPFAPDASNPVGSKLDAFSVDQSESYAGSASIRFDVPNANDPNGNFAGGIFRIDGVGRNLTGYDALTFWAKASQGATIAQIGFGEDFFENKYKVLRENLDLSTNWQKYIIPIPDPSKLFHERGMLTYAAAPIGAEGTGLGYTFWIDELKFEKLGTVAQPQPAIFGGEDRVEQTFIGSSFTITGTQTFNTVSGLFGSGINETVSAAPSYFTFNSTDVDVARVTELGVVSIVGSGTAEITAILGGVKAKGSLTVESIGTFDPAPTPDRDANDVISVFSDAYSSVNDLNIGIFSGQPFGAPAVEIGLIDTGSDQIIDYKDLGTGGFVGIGWQGSLDVSTQTNIHLDILVSGSFVPSNALTIEIIDFGTDDSDGGGDDTGGGINILGSQLTEGTWVGIDIPVNGFTLPTGGGFAGSPNLNNVARVVFVGAGISNILVDNIYFYRE